MSEFSALEDTLFVPMLGRIYASEHFPHIFWDEKAMDLRKKLPKIIKGQDTQTQYTLLAGAVRSANMDRCITRFLNETPDGIVVELGCGLETTFYRNDNGRTLWYEVDLPAVIAYRQQLLGQSERDRTIVADAFSPTWIQEIRAKHPSVPILVTASGLLYYFEQAQVWGLFQMLQAYGPIDVVFDTVNAKGMKRMHTYMKQVGHADAAMYFYVDSGEALARQIGAVLVMEEPYYTHIQKRGLQVLTSMTMRISDHFNMVKMIQLRLHS